MNTEDNKYENINDLVSKAEHLVNRRSAEALPIAQKINELAIKHHNPQYYALAQYIMAFYKCLVENDYDEAIGLCKGTMHNLEREGQADLAYLFYMTMGNAYQFKGEVFSAQESYLNGLKQLEDKQNLNNREKGFLASFYYNLSLVLVTTQLNINAEEYLQKAIALYEEIGNLFKLSKSYGAYTWLLEKRGEYDKAIANIQKSLDIDLQLNEPYSIAISKANVGSLYIRVERYEEANEYLEQALEYFSSNNKLYEVGLVKVNIGEALGSVNKITEALKYMHEAEALFAEMDNRQELTKIHLVLSQYYKQVSNHERALHHMELHLDGVKKLYDAEKTNALARAKKEFENEQQEKERLILMQKNEEISMYVRKLEVSNNELKQFAHVASHDMREPLRMIYSYMSLLQKNMAQSITPVQQEFISYAIDGAKRLDVLIQDILNLAKVNSNPKYRPLKLNMIAEEIKWNLDALLKDRNATITYDQLPEIDADRTQMLQLFQNLMANGIKYNRKPNPIIHVIVKDAGTHVQIGIADNGPGIPPNQREKVFEIFQRLESNRDISGTGMGLAICRKIVESMDGKIWIEDNLPEGTVFMFTLRKKNAI
ncbi:MAG: tetratricopeptide repeat protein [Chitinophagales bacterium]|nr:tetratricopeptide repeat protein [Chitinophagales bacterium]